LGVGGVVVGVVGVVVVGVVVVVVVGKVTKPARSGKAMLARTKAR